MSKVIDDRTGDARVDGAVQDGFRYVVKLKDGTKEYYRDADDITHVTARLDEALAINGGLSPAGVPISRLAFSGARAIEGQMVFEPDEHGNEKEPADVIGEVRGKGWVWAARVDGITYTRFDEDRAQVAAYEAAAALLESQNQAQAEALGTIQELQRKALEGTGLEGAGVPGQAEEPGASLMG
jgi:hypothetical protein